MSFNNAPLTQNEQQLQALLLAEQASSRALLAEYQTVLAKHAAQLQECQTQHAEVVKSLQAELAKAQRKCEGLERQLARLLRRQYGPQKERIDPNQLTLFSAEELTRLAHELEQDAAASDNTEVPAETDTAASDAADSDATTNNATPEKKKGHGRRPLPEHLPREVVTHELSEEERACPCCGKTRNEIGSETSEQLEYIPASLKVIQHERMKYVCEHCEAQVSVAEKPAQPIDKGLPGPGLLAHCILSKYGDYLPLYRQEDILSRHGIIIRRSTLTDWVGSSALILKPLYELMCDRVRASKVIHTDDTSIKMLAEPACLNCKFWGYAGDSANPYAVYEFSLTREAEAPVEFLTGFSGYLQADAYTGYDQIYKTTTVIEVACMAHCRRYWWEARTTDSKRAHEALAYISRLYQLEDKFRQTNMTGDALRDARLKYAIPILNAFRKWLDESESQVLPKSPIGQAFIYTRNQWTALCRYTEHGALSIDNNCAERLMKLPAIGRKNYLFVGSEEGGNRAAIILSMIASAKLNHVEPLAWLTALLREIPRRLAACGESPPEKNDTPSTSTSTAASTPSVSKSAVDLTDLLPDAWLKAHPENRWVIDDLRQPEREKNRQRQKTR